MEDTSPYTPDSVFERQKENQNVFIPIGNEEAPVGNQDAFGNLGKSGNNQTPKGPLSVFIPRDYSEGELCQFSLNFPPALEGKIDPAILSDVVKNINLIMRDAETINKSHVLESIFGCLSCYLSYLFMTSYYQKCINKLTIYIDQENQKHFHPFGLHLKNPKEVALQHLEIVPHGLDP